MAQSKTENNPISIKKFKQTAKNNWHKPVLIALGVFGGSRIAIMLDKQLSGKKVFGIEGEKLKPWAKTGVNLVGGGLLALIRNPNFKLLGAGLATNGVFQGYKGITKKDLLSLQGMENNYVGSPLQAIEEISATPGATPLNLPLLQIDEEAEDMIDRAAEEPEEVVEGTVEGNVEGNLESTDVALGKSEDQIAGENETIMEDDDFEEEMDAIP